MEALFLCEVYVLEGNIQKPDQNRVYLYPNDQWLVDPNKHI